MLAGVMSGPWPPHHKPGLRLLFGIHLPGNVPGDAVPDTLARDNRRQGQLLLVLVEILGKVLPLFVHQGSADVFDVRWFDSHE